MSFDFGISATQSALSNWQNNEFQQEANKKERQFQWDMSQYEFENAVEMWNRTNLYNSPAEQRKRLEAAGLNPALMYGKGASPGIASPAPSMDLPESGNYGRGMGFETQINGIQGILNAYNDLRRTNADVQKTEQETNNLWTDGQIKNVLHNLMLLRDDDVNTKDSLGHTRWANAYLNKMENEAASSKYKANWDQEKWNIYDQQGIFLDQMTNAGRVLERELGREAAVIFDAVFGKIKNR